MNCSIAKSCIELGKGLTGEAPSEVIGSSFALVGGIAIGMIELTALTAYISLMKVATFFIPGNYSKKIDDFLYTVVAHTGSILAEIISIFFEKRKEYVKAFFASENALRFSYVHIDGLSPHIHAQRAVNALHKASVVGRSVLVSTMPTIHYVVVSAFVYGAAYLLAKQFENSSIITKVALGAVLGACGGQLGAQIVNSLSPACRYRLRKKIVPVFQFFSKMKDKVLGTHSLREFDDSPFGEALKTREELVRMIKNKQ